MNLQCDRARAAVAARALADCARIHVEHLDAVRWRIWTESMSDSSLAKAKSTMSSRFELLHPLISSHFIKIFQNHLENLGFRDCRAKGGLLDRDEVLSAASALAAVPFSSRQVLLDDGVNHRMS